MSDAKIGPVGVTTTQSLDQQLSQLQYMQNAATANGNGTPVPVAGYTGAQQVEIVESGGGTCTVTLQGSMDGTNWYAVGYQQVDAVASPARSVSAISVSASAKHVYQVLDPYEQLRAVISAVANGAVVSARVYMVPA